MKVIWMMKGVRMARDREFFVNEKDVTKVIKAIQDNILFGAPSLCVGNCGWANRPETWFVMVRLRRKTYNRVLDTLNQEGVILESK